MAFSVASLLGLLLLPVFCFSSEQHFSYEGNQGPQNWGKLYPNYCSGKRQSPININTKTAKIVRRTPMDAADGRTYLTTATNNGHSIMLESNETVNRVEIFGGPLNCIYKFKQCHFHWGKNNSEGSEHTIDKIKYPMEMHCVFFKKEYGSMEKAINYSDGLVVVTSIIKIGKSNPNFNPIVDATKQCETAGSKVALKKPILLRTLFPSKCWQKKTCYYAYPGSLTTPSCNEVVTFLICEDFQYLSSEQIKVFRNIKDSENKTLTHNYRPVQPIHNRKISKYCG